MKKLFVFLIILFTNLSFAQSKKEQIELLNLRIDSLMVVLQNDRNGSLKLVQEHNQIIDKLNSDLGKSEQKNTMQEKEIYRFEQLNKERTTEIEKLRKMHAETTDSIAKLLQQCRENKFSSKLNYSENNYDQIALNFKTKTKELDDCKKWITNVVQNEFPLDTTYVTPLCMDYIQYNIQSYLGYIGEDELEIYNPTKLKEYYDFKYSKFHHLFETGNCGWQSRKILQLDYLGELNNGYWFNIVIKGGCGFNDYSNTIKRVIKIIKRNNNFYIDNFLSFSEE
jgi:hypothetical protein